MSEEETDSLSVWRWNRRLAMVVGGLTLFLLGALAGRGFRPELIAAVASSQSAKTEAVLPPETAAIAEVNPPLSIVEIEPKDPLPAVAATSAVESKTTVSTPPPAEPIAAAIVPAAEVAVPVPPPADVTALALPVALKGEVVRAEPAAAMQVCEPPEKYEDRKLSTALTWAESVQEAAQRAAEEEKLVFLIHVSGNFELPGFT